MALHFRARYGALGGIRYSTLLKFHQSMSGAKLDIEHGIESALLMLKLDHAGIHVDQGIQ